MLAVLVPEDTRRNDAHRELFWCSITKAPGTPYAQNFHHPDPALLPPPSSRSRPHPGGCRR